MIIDHNYGRGVQLRTSLRLRYKYQILVCLGRVQALLVMSMECANRSKDGATSCHHY